MVDNEEINKMATTDAIIVFFISVYASFCKGSLFSKSVRIVLVNGLFITPPSALTLRGESRKSLPVA
jgi:hypothetical protein